MGVYEKRVSTVANLLRLGLIVVENIAAGNLSPKLFVEAVVICRRYVCAVLRKRGHFLIQNEWKQVLLTLNNAVIVRAHIEGEKDLVLLG